MPENISLPAELTSAIGAETVDFAVKANRIQPLKKSISIFFLGIGWTLFAILALFIFIGPSLRNETSTMKVNGVEKVVQPGDFGTLFAPAAILGFSILIGIIIIISSIQAMLKEGGFFAGTPTRLINCQKNNLKSIDWEQFSGNIKTDGNSQKGNIELEMRTGKMVSQKRKSDKFVPDVLYISEIPNAFEIAEICRKRIKENDPTPPLPENNIV